MCFRVYIYNKVWRGVGCFGGGTLVLRLLFAVLFAVVVVCYFAFLCLLLNLLCFLCVVS